MSMELTRGNIDEEWCHDFPNISVIVNKYCLYKQQLLLSQQKVPVLLTAMWNACNTPTCGLLVQYCECELWILNPVRWGHCYWHSVRSVFYGAISVGVATHDGLGGLGIESRWESRFFVAVQTGPRAHPASYTMGTVVHSWGWSGRGVNLTIHPHLAPRLRKE